MGDELERETPGLGLGLHIVRTIVRRLNGKVRVKDRDGGPGTTFEVTLPIKGQSQLAVNSSHLESAAKKAEVP
jgi:signal transduction histidine kinase